MQLVLYSEIPAHDETLRRQWNDLVLQMESPEVFYTYEWALAVQRAYNFSILPLLLLAYEKDSLVGVAALATDVSRASAFFLPASTADYCDFLCSPERRNELIEAVLTELRKLGIQMLTLANIPADSATARRLKASAWKHGYYQFARPAYICRRVLMGSPQQRQEMKESLLARKKIRRYLRTMQKDGPVTLSHLKTWQSIDEAMAEFTAAHVARFLARGRVSNLARLARRHFLYELTRLLSDPGWVVLTRMSVGERPVAWNYGFQFCGSWFWYQPTFDIRLEGLSPGFCLLSKIVAEACASPDISLLDLGLGAEGYKERLATSLRQTLHITLTTTLHRHVGEVARYYLSTTARASPRIEHGIRSALSRVSALWQRLRAFGVSRFVAWSAKLVWTEFVDCQEVLFYQLPETRSLNLTQKLSPEVALKSIDLELLATAAMEYVDDGQTMGYLLRCAKRLGSEEKGRGFALVTMTGVPVHFCWAGPFEGFHMVELNSNLTAPSAEAVILFDCWTPAWWRGRGYYGTTAQLVSEQIRREGKSVWIFSAASNTSSLRELEKSGFQRRYSMARRKILLWQRVSKRPVEAVPVTRRSYSRTGS